MYQHDGDRFMSEEERDAMIRQLERGGVSGVNAPDLQAGDVPPPTALPAAPASAKSLQDILSGHAYGAKGLADAEGELTAAGYQLQKDSGGRVRGRLKSSSGDIIDVIGQGEGSDWWNNPTASAWNINNRGQEGLDAGGWSFGGGGSGSRTMPLSGGAEGSTFSGIQGLMPTDTDFYQRLQSEVQRLLGGTQATDRDALLRMLGA